LTVAASKIQKGFRKRKMKERLKQFKEKVGTSQINLSNFKTARPMSTHSARITHNNLADPTITMDINSTRSKKTIDFQFTDTSAYFSYFINFRLSKFERSSSALPIRQATYMNSSKHVDNMAKNVLNAAKTNFVGYLRKKLDQITLSHVLIKDEFLNTPLHYACGNGNYEIANILLKLGADPNIQNKEGNTPLHEAFKNGNEIVKFWDD